MVGRRGGLYRHPLAVVSGVHTPWITVGVIRVSPTDRMRLKRFIHSPMGTHIEDAALIDHHSHSSLARTLDPTWSGMENNAV